MGKSKDLFLEEQEKDAHNVPPQEQEEQNSAYIELMERLRNKEERLSYSSLKAFAKSPREFINYKLKAKTPPNEGQIFGSLCDCFITEEDKFDKKFVVIDKVPTSDNQKGFCQDMFDGESKEQAFANNYKRGSAEDTYNSMKEYIEGHLSGKMICTSDQVEKAKEVVANLKKSPLVMQYLDSCESFQNKLEWEYRGWKFRGFTDGDGPGLIVDLKFDGKTSEPGKFERVIMDRKYYMQFGMYATAKGEIPECYVIVYDKSFNFSVIKLDYTLINYGIREYQYLIKKLDECVKDNRWNESFNFFDHSSSIRTMYKPKWVPGFDAEEIVEL